MSSVQRGVYQPLADRVPIYDLADEDPEEERSRAPLLVVIALVVLAAFAGVVWIAYNQGVERGRQGASLVITAPEGPVRVAPPEASPTTDFTNLKVYKDPVPPDQEAKGSILAPEAPAIAEAPPIRLTQTPPPAAAPPRPAPAAATAAAPAARPAQTTQAARPATPTAPPPRPAAVATPPAAPPAAAPVQTAQAARPAAAPAAASQAASRALSGAAVLQIGAFENEQMATAAWTAFRTRHDTGGQLAPDIQRADIAGRGTVYRLRVGPFADRTAATDACVRFKAAGATCFVSAP